jgi:hypothetical protein
VADGTSCDSGSKLKYDMGTEEGETLPQQEEEAGRPIPFITVDMDGDKPGMFSVTDEAKEALASIEGPLAVGVSLRRFLYSALVSVYVCLSCTHRLQGVSPCKYVIFVSWYAPGELQELQVKCVMENAEVCVWCVCVCARAFSHVHMHTHLYRHMQREAYKFIQ